MLTQGPTPDLKCGLNITSFLTLPHRLHCAICAKDIMVTVVTSSNEEMERLEGGLFVRVLCFSYVLFCFCVVVGVPSCLLHDSLLYLFHCSFSAFFFSGLFN